MFTSAFSRSRQFACFDFEFSLALCDIFLLLIGCRDYFNFGFQTLNQKSQLVGFGKCGKTLPNFKYV